jgi:hypothetical protein
VIEFGITESGDPVFDDSWIKWVEKGRPAKLVTKDAKELISRYGRALFSRKILIDATITGYGGSVIEPGVPRPDDELAYLNDLPAGWKKKITIRIDPIIPLPEFVDRSLKVQSKAVQCGFRDFRVSIMDYYRHVRERFGRISYDLQGRLDKVYYGDMGYQSWMMSEAQNHLDLGSRREILAKFFHPAKVVDNNGVDEEVEPGIEPRICGEPGLPCDGCVSRSDYEKLDLWEDDALVFPAGKRVGCNCLCTKRELLKMKGPCAHKCAYCYWIGVEDKIGADS